MNLEYTVYLDKLNDPSLKVRLENLRKIYDLVNERNIMKPVSGDDVNNHIHTTYSFSPYSPTKAVWVAYMSGLKTAGIMDHDSISGAREFIEAGKIVGMATTIGVECRADFSKTPLKGRRLNNPDQKSIAYMTIHGVPHTMIDTVKNFFVPYLKARNIRNRHMVDKINGILEPHDISISFDDDVVPLSKSAEGGSITERHILFALSCKLCKKIGKGRKLVEFLTERLGLDISDKVKGYLLDEGNPFYAYDLLGALKSDMVEAFYIDAEDECPDVTEVIEFSRSIGAIPAYAYLGDVGISVTGDKKAQKFEDDYLDELFVVLKDLGFAAVTYMPSRNTMQQLRRVKGLCEKHGMFQISGEDINSPRQSFVCEHLRTEEFSNLIDSTWALIGHEKMATMDIEKGMFSDSVISKYPDLESRIKMFGKVGKGECKSIDGLED